MKVLIVDDSVVFRSQIAASLQSVNGIEVVGSASNGKIALQRLEQLSVDIVTLDMEMPELNGIETLKEIRKVGYPVKVILFSSQTLAGAEKTLEALKLGADDFVAKPSGEHLNFETAAKAVQDALIPKVLQFMSPQGVSDLRKINAPSELFKREIPTNGLTPSSGRVVLKKSIRASQPRALVIASSTGGPAALVDIFSKVKGPLKIPIFIAQHMPPVFTQILAKRIFECSGIKAKEAEDGERADNQIYIAPGDFHLEVESKNSQIHLKLTQLPQRNSVRPAADYLFETAAQVFGSQVIGFVLTGMGEDGLVGARAIKERDGGIVIQNKESSVVFGMPGSVFQESLQDEVMDINQLAECISFLAT